MPSTTRIKNDNFFPELNIENLKVLYVENWIGKNPDISIDRVILYHYRSNTYDYIRYRRGDTGLRSPKYAIVFEFGENADLFECDFLKPSGAFNHDSERGLSPDAPIAELLKAGEAIKTNACIEFIKQKLEYPDLSSGRFFGLLNSGFGSNVYRRGTPNRFYEDWIFLPRWKGRVSLLEAAGRVKTDSPHCVLFERDIAVSKRPVLSVEDSNLNSKSEHSRQMAKTKWDRVKKAYDRPLKEARDLWNSGDKRLHTQMRDYLWDKYPEMTETPGASERKLLELLKGLVIEFGREEDLIFGNKGVKKKKKADYNGFWGGGR
jgi:hypothetical protein